MDTYCCAVGEQQNTSIVKFRPAKINIGALNSGTILVLIDKIRILRTSITARHDPFTLTINWRNIFVYLVVLCHHYVLIKLLWSKQRSLRSDSSHRAYEGSKIPCQFPSRARSSAPFHHAALHWWQAGTPSSSRSGIPHFNITLANITNAGEITFWS